ncbi:MULTISPECIES: hypothetical protein [unclassified Nocardia]|nr:MULTISPECIES: hypothetical protein [unclassified Nocardia]
MPLGQHDDRAAVRADSAMTGLADRRTKTNRETLPAALPALTRLAELGRR